MTTATRPPASESDRLTHRARMRARAASIVDGVPVRRDFRVSAGAVLRGAARRRVHAAKPRRLRWERPPLRRQATVAILVVQLAGLIALLLLPAFQVRGVTISGAHLLTRNAILAAADVPDASIFMVDGSAVRSRLLAMPWIRTATVSTSLPNQVSISITEWSPVLRIHHRGQDTLVADSGATIDAAAGEPSIVAKIPVLVDERDTSTTRIDPALVQTLDAASSRFPAVFGVGVSAYQWRADGVLVIWTSAGWSVVLGHMDSAEAVANIPAQLSELASLHATLNFTAPGFGYVDLENPGAPAVGGKPGLPADVQAALTFQEPAQPAPSASPTAAAPASSSSATPAPTPAPTARPTPTPAPTPTPITIYVLPTPHS